MMTRRDAELLGKFLIVVVGLIFVVGVGIGAIVF